MSAPEHDQAMEERLANEIGALRLSPHTPAPRAPSPHAGTPPDPPSLPHLQRATRRRIRVLTGTGPIPHSPLLEPSLDAAGEVIPVCPVQHCGFVSTNARPGVEMVRHLRAHFPGSCPFRCVGRPVHMFSIAGLLALPSRLSGTYAVDGVDHVGGCGKVFSRRDALWRHLNRGDCLSMDYCARVNGDFGGASA